jgi:DNA mismatch repair protein MutL
MAARIQILPEEVINKISAGEIIERPASVVKELVENSIDSGAARVAVEVARGGRDLIRVVDNGCGMEKEDALLSFERHSTSKISSAEDIAVINTLGFRGEALPSISAVSQMELTTRTEKAETGTRITLAGEKVKSVKEAGCPAGTSVSVEQLFFNTPARRKFMKTIPTEMSHIINILSREALVRSEVSFELTHNDKAVFNAPAGTTLLERILYLYGDELSDALIPFEGKNNWLKVHGLLGKPEYARSQSHLMLFFVNKRPVRNRLLSHAIMEGYKPLLTRDRFPVIFIFIEIAPELIDVNIHPQKAEVKFEKTRAVHEFISQLIKDLLKKEEFVPGLFQPSVKTGRETRIKEAVEKYIAGAGVKPVPGKAKGAPPREGGREGDRKDSLYAKKAAGTGEKELISDYIPVAQLHNTYIVAESKDSVIIIDQHAAHERVLYEQLKSAFQKAKVERQVLLLPFTVEATQGASALIKEKLALFTSLGFEVEHFGGNSFILRTVPALLKYVEPRRFFLDVVDDLAALGEVKDAAQLREKMITIMACRSAVKAGDKLKEDEMTSLFHSLSETQSPHICPHGRPTLIKLTLPELEKRFKRRE